MRSERAISLIMRHTRVTRQHLTPELQLRLVTPECELWTARSDEVPFANDPFWGFYWPGGQAIARYILDNGSTLRNKSILDVGCGCGAAAIAAVKANAKCIVANDIDPYALLATRINANLNRTEIKTSEENYIGTNCDQFDTILIGDMFYDEEFANNLFDWLKEKAYNGKTILIGDPGRHALSGERRAALKLLAKYELPENSCLENRGFQETTVWKFNNYGL